VLGAIYEQNFLDCSSGGWALDAAGRPQDGCRCWASRRAGWVPGDGQPA